MNLSRDTTPTNLGFVDPAMISRPIVPGPPAVKGWVLVAEAVFALVIAPGIVFLLLVALP